MWDKLKSIWREFRNDEPGERMQDLYKNIHSEDTPTIIRWLFPVLGILVLAAGLILIPFPGPGSLITFLGAGMIATEIKPMAKWLDWFEVLLRKAKDEAFDWWRTSPLSAKLAVEALVAAVIVGFGFAGYQVFTGDWWLTTK